MIGDILNRSLSLTEHYTDDGILPRKLMFENFFYPTWFTLHAASGFFSIQLFLFGIHILSALSLTIGFHSRISCIITWVLTVSLQFRNILILHGGDTLLRFNLFYFIFLPIGSRFSIDSLSNTTSDNCNILYNFSTAAFILNVIIMYFWNFMNKYGAAWTIDYTATELALQMEYFQTILGYLILTIVPRLLLQVGTFIVLYFEGFGWILFISPIKCQTCRLIGVILFMIMHLLFGTCLSIGLFLWIALATLIVFLPSKFWEHKLPNYYDLYFNEWILKQSSKTPKILNTSSHKKEILKRIPKKLKYTSSTILFLLSILPLLCVIWSQLWCISMYNGFSFYPPAYSIGTGLHLDPLWEMFAPEPGKEDHHVILEGIFRNGTKMELFKNQGIFKWKGSKIDNLPSITYKQDIYSHRWAKYYESLFGHLHARELQDRFLQFVCNGWIKTHEDPPLYIILKKGIRSFTSIEKPFTFSSIQELLQIRCY